MIIQWVLISLIFCKLSDTSSVYQIAGEPKSHRELPLPPEVDGFEFLTWLDWDPDYSGKWLWLSTNEDSRENMEYACHNLHLEFDENQVAFYNHLKFYLECTKEAEEDAEMVPKVQHATFHLLNSLNIKKSIWSGHFDMSQENEDRRCMMYKWNEESVTYEEVPAPSCMNNYLALCVGVPLHLSSFDDKLEKPGTNVKGTKTKLKSNATDKQENEEISDEEDGLIEDEPNEVLMFNSAMNSIMSRSLMSIGSKPGIPLNVSTKDEVLNSTPESSQDKGSTTTEDNEESESTEITSTTSKYEIGNTEGNLGSTTDAFSSEEDEIGTTMETTSWNNNESDLTLETTTGPATVTLAETDQLLDSKNINVQYVIDPKVYPNIDEESETASFSIGDVEIPFQRNRILSEETTMIAEKEPITHPDLEFLAISTTKIEQDLITEPTTNTKYVEEISEPITIADFNRPLENNTTVPTLFVQSPEPQQRMSKMKDPEPEEKQVLKLSNIVNIDPITTEIPSSEEIETTTISNQIYVALLANLAKKIPLTSGAGTKPKYFKPPTLIPTSEYSKPEEIETSTTRKTRSFTKSTKVPKNLALSTPASIKPKYFKPIDLVPATTEYLKNEETETSTAVEIRNFTTKVPKNLALSTPTSIKPKYVKPTSLIQTTIEYSKNEEIETSTVGRTRSFTKSTKVPKAPALSNPTSMKPKYVKPTDQIPTTTEPSNDEKIETLMAKNPFNFLQSIKIPKNIVLIIPTSMKPTVKPADVVLTTSESSNYEKIDTSTTTKPFNAKQSIKVPKNIVLTTSTSITPTYVKPTELISTTSESSNYEKVETSTTKEPFNAMQSIRTTKNIVLSTPTSITPKYVKPTDLILTTSKSPNYEKIETSTAKKPFNAIQSIRTPGSIVISTITGEKPKYVEPTRIETLGTTTEKNRIQIGSEYKAYKTYDPEIKSETVTSQSDVDNILNENVPPKNGDYRAVLNVTAIEENDKEEPFVDSDFSLDSKFETALNAPMSRSLNTADVQDTTTESPPSDHTHGPEHQVKTKKPLARNAHKHGLRHHNRPHKKAKHRSIKMKKRPKKTKATTTRKPKISISIRPKKEKARISTKRPSAKAVQSKG